MNSRSLHPVSPEKILVREANWLGDAVMTTPALQRLREHFPGAHIALLTHEKLRDLWLHYECINEIITFKAGENPFSIGRKLRPQGFDLAVVLPNSSRSALETWLAGIRARIGYARPLGRVLLSRPIPTVRNRMKKRTPAEIRRLIEKQRWQPGQSCAEERRALPDDGFSFSNSIKTVHQTDLYLRLVGSLGANRDRVAPTLRVSDAELESARSKWLNSVSPTPNKATAPIWIGLSPSAAYGPAKCWPLENFAEVVEQISARIPDCRWLAFGGPDDVNTCEQLTRKSGGRVLNLAGRTTIRDLMALLSLCKVVLTNDSGPMHLAAALGTAVIVPFGSTSPALTGPGVPGDPRHVLLSANVPCSPCFRRTCPIDLRCMTQIPVSSVSEAVMKAL